MQTDKFYQVQPSLRTLLVLALEDSLPVEVERWKAEIESGTISEQLLRVFIAMDWVTSSRDSRLSLIEDKKDPARMKLTFPDNEVPVKPSPNQSKV